MVTVPDLLAQRQRELAYLDGIFFSCYHLDMRKKVSTQLDEGLFRRAKLESAIQGKQLSEIIGEALSQYLEKRAGAGLGQDRVVVAETWATMKLAPSKLRTIMAEEDWIDS